jgi:cold shock protein
MNIFAKLAISVLVCAAAAAVASIVVLQGQHSVVLYGLFIASGIVCTLLANSGGQPQASAASKPKARPVKKQASTGTPSTDGPRETGSVKWFNGNKGFGFIVRDNGEEIFVHFRSIMGDGRRSLRDGQPVTFTVVDTDKGPQAEEVEILP